MAILGLDSVLDIHTAVIFSLAVEIFMGYNQFDSNKTFKQKFLPYVHVLTFMMMSQAT